MKKSKKILEFEDDLVFPDAPDFISKPPKYTQDEINKLNQKMLRYWNEQRYSKPRPKFIGEAFKL